MVAATRYPGRRDMAPVSSSGLLPHVFTGSASLRPGYFLGQVTFVKSNIELILIGIVVLSVLPIAVEFLRARRTTVRSG